jgi:hypothetical protein
VLATFSLAVVFLAMWLLGSRHARTRAERAVSRVLSTENSGFYHAAGMRWVLRKQIVYFEKNVSHVYWLELHLDGGFAGEVFPDEGRHLPPLARAVARYGV